MTLCIFLLYSMYMYITKEIVYSNIQHFNAFITNYNTNKIEIDILITKQLFVHTEIILI